MKDVQALIALLVWTLLCPARACNGAAAFCDLPLTKVTFATTHNSGAFRLKIPELVKVDVPGVNVLDALKCFYENHDMKFLQQLDFGIRGFNLDLCTDIEKPGIYFNCHGSPPAMGLDFANDLDRFKDWLEKHPQEVVVLTAGNFKVGLNPGKQWEELIESKFGGPCIEINKETNVSDWSNHSEVSCVVVRSRPSEAITLGLLINSNLRVVVWPLLWKEQRWVHSTYDPLVNPGASSSSLLKDYAKYAEGQKPLNESTSLVLNIIGAPKVPNPARLNACKDIFCQVEEAEKMVGDLELSCIKDMSTRFNRDLLQGDATEHKYFTDETCPEYACGCLGYQSPLEVLQQKLLKMGHAISLLSVDYPERGKHSNVADVARRMNEATVRFLSGEDELGADWWSCHYDLVLGVTLSSGLVLLCAACCLAARFCPNSLGRCFRMPYDAYKRRANARAEGRERGREEAFAHMKAQREAGFGMNPSYGMAGGQYMGYGGNPGYGMHGAAPQEMGFGGMGNANYVMQGMVPQQIPPRNIVAPAAGQHFQKLTETE